MSPRAGAAPATVVLEVSPRVAKMMAASSAPFQIQRLAAHVLSEETDDPLASLRALLATGSVSARQVGLLFGRETFSLRTLELPSSHPKEIASMLDLQLGKLTPYPRAEILSAWTMIGSFRDGYTSVLLAIGRKVVIESVLQFLKTKGIAPEWVGVSTEGLESWWAQMPKAASAPAEGQLLALIDVDAVSTDCAILSGSRLIFTHHIAIGSTQLTSDDPAKLRWTGELVRLPRVLLHEDVKGKIIRGVVTGMTEGLQPLVDQLATQWGVAIEVLDALTPFAPSLLMRQSASAQRVSFAALAGIVGAGKPPRIDLIPQETRVLQALDVRSRRLARLAASLAAILVLTVVLYLERTLTLGHYLGQVQARLAKLEPAAQQVVQRRQTMQQIQAWLDPAASALEAVAAVAAAANDGITVTQLSFAEHAPMKIRGVATEVRGPYEFADRLKQQPSSVTKAGCYVANAKGTGSRGTEFEVVCGKSDS